MPKICFAYTLHTEECELYMLFIIRDCYIVLLTIIYSNVSDFVAGGHVKKWTNICHVWIDNEYEEKNEKCHFWILCKKKIGLKKSYQ